MKQTCILLAVVGLMACATIGFGATYNFAPGVPDLNDLVHQSYYTWGINWALPAGEQITSATLTYQNIYDWTYEDNDHLYTHLLNSVTDPNGSTDPNFVQKTGYQTITIEAVDNEGGGDNFAGQGVLIGDWTDPFGDSAHAINLPLTIPSAQFSWLSDGNFGFGIDPDCHYYNCGVQLQICTRTTPGTAVPEPMSLILGLMGLSSVAGIKRLRGK